MKKNSLIKSTFQDLLNPLCVSILIRIILKLFTPKLSGWPYGHTGDSLENIRTAFLGAWGYVPIKDIAINHMPGVPEIILLASKFGKFLYSENGLISESFIKNISFSVFIALQVFISYTSIRFFFNKKIAFIGSFFLIIYTTYHVYYFLPLSETIIPFFMMLWGSLYIYSERQNLSERDLNSNICSLFIILMLITWLGLTSPFSLFLLGIYTIFLGSNRNILQIIINLKNCLICSLIFLLILNFRYGLSNIYKWIIIANRSLDFDKFGFYSIIENIKRQLITNLHGNIFDNQLIPIIILISCLIIYFYSKRGGYILNSKCNFRSINEYDIYCKKYFLIRIPSFAFLVFTCQVLDGWRIPDSPGFGFSQLYKTEASWGLVIPLICFFILSLNKLLDLRIFKDIPPEQNRLRKYFLIYILIGYLVFAFFIGNFSVFSSKKLSIKPQLKGIPTLQTKQKFLKGNQKCGVLDSWAPGAWITFDIQPCLGVFINSIPKLTKVQPFKDDILKLIKNNTLTLRGIKEVSDKDIWPVYQRQFANYLSCNELEHTYSIKCEGK